MKNNGYAKKKDEKVEELSPFEKAFAELAEWKGKIILDVALTKGGIAIACPSIARDAKSIVTLVTNKRDLSWTNEQIKKRRLADKVKGLVYNAKTSLNGKYDMATFYGALHHSDPSKSLKMAHDYLKDGGEVVIFDGFFPEQARDIYTGLSKKADPTNRLHLTYHEVVNAVRNNGFDIMKIVPVQYKASFEKTILKYPEGIRSETSKIFKNDKSIKQQMGMHRDKATGKWFYFYELFVMLAKKGQPLIIVQK